MPKLTDTQLVSLSAAAKRSDGNFLPLPKSLKVNKGAAVSVLKSLLKHGLAEERPAEPGQDTWREAADGSRIALIIADVGLRAIGAIPVQEPSTAAKAVGPSKTARRPSRRAASTGAPGKAKGNHPRTGTKLALLVDLLSRKGGATIAEAVESTGWQAHSVRGAISGALKKKLGLTVTSAAVEGRGRVYRIA